MHRMRQEEKGGRQREAELPFAFTRRPLHNSSILINSPPLNSTELPLITDRRSANRLSIGVNKSLCWEERKEEGDRRRD